MFLRLQNPDVALLGISEIGPTYESPAPGHVVPMEDTCVTKLMYKPGQKYYSRSGDTFLEVFLPGYITTRAFWVHSSRGCADFPLVYSCASCLQHQRISDCCLTLPHYQIQWIQWLWAVLVFCVFSGSETHRQVRNFLFVNS